EAGVGGGLRRRVHHGHQAVAREPVEVLVYQMTGLHRLRPGRLPAGAGQRLLHTRGKHAEADCHHDPGGDHHAEVRGGPVTEAPDRTEPAHRSTHERTPNTRPMTIDAGQAPTTTYS